MKSIKVVAAIIKKDDRIFATQRGYGDFKDWWEFPGGKLEAGETPEEALVREIKEELDTEIRVDDYLMTVEYDYPEFHLSMDCFWCSIISGKLTLLEHEAAKWLPVNDLKQVNWLPADMEIIERIAAVCQNQTLSYYDSHAADFANSTADVDFSETQKRFTEKLPEGALILDFGCGAGRDTKFFLEQGFRVDAVDGSKELCLLASEYTGIPVRQMLFGDLEDVSKYDAIWACASILHLEKGELLKVMQKMQRALKPGGILYTSFKYGDFEGVRGGRYFIDMTETRFAGLMKEVNGFAVEETWVTADVRPGREDEKWLNLILRKN